MRSGELWNDDHSGSAQAFCVSSESGRNGRRRTQGQGRVEEWKDPWQRHNPVHLMALYGNGESDGRNLSVRFDIKLQAIAVALRANLARQMILPMLGEGLCYRKVRGLMCLEMKLTDLVSISIQGDRTDQQSQDNCARS